MSKIIAFVFLIAGIAIFLIPTELLSDTSEGALVDGSYGLVAGVLGFIGALIGRNSPGRALGIGLAFAVGSVLLLFLFFVGLWPML
jgi:hypothetical protein